MKRLEIESRILKVIKKQKKSTIFFAEDFLEIGSLASINKALSRLSKKNLIIRLAHGIYLNPEVDEILGVLYPTLDEIAQIIAKRDRSRIIPTGDLAMNILGLTTQIPMNVVYLTDGSPRSIKVGKRSIKFKKTAPKNLSLQGEISCLVIQAIKKIGKDKITEAEIKKIHDVLKKEKPINISHDMKLSPAWVRNLIKTIISREEINEVV